MRTIRNFVNVCLVSPFLLLTACNNETPHLSSTQEQQDTALEAVFTAPLPAAEGLADLLNNIRATAGVAYAQSLSSCKLAEVGVKACGGPERYIIYSTEVAHEETLLGLIAQYNQTSAALNSEAQLVSDCSVIAKPRVTLNNGICVPVATATH